MCMGALTTRARGLRLVARLAKAGAQCTVWEPALESIHTIKVAIGRLLFGGLLPFLLLLPLLIHMGRV